MDQYHWWALANIGAGSSRWVCSRWYIISTGKGWQRQMLRSMTEQAVAVSPVRLRMPLGQLLLLSFSFQPILRAVQTGALFAVSPLHNNADIRQVWPGNDRSLFPACSHGCVTQTPQSCFWALVSWRSNAMVRPPRIIMTNPAMVTLSWLSPSITTPQIAARGSAIYSIGATKLASATR